ncbi:lipid-A-disaccharide synthase N-terminal domain-containing protein [Limimaricola cinnabarinus]|jgi:lipid-A-disaccharide synthase-like uncharacterized protein|uniref:Lipid A biosynthesis n=1 Tax=Limimaricola cinnabarinus TaxID=1125964 RepID=A0A2G1MJZ8_9RHOB|nr:lipid-A-disaccharide synthase N-terminal domain-containing protein [Limimaricola cinnabarinus]PHP29073.1 lipid A biosynthesis [Limimaricola cinnabarinus]
MSLFTDWFAETGWVELTWLGIGFLAQALFSARFLIQWIASERVRKSIVPEAFWYFSAGGGAMLLAYAIYRRDPVFILGQAFGLMVYARNIYFIWNERQSESRAEP